MATSKATPSNERGKMFENPVLDALTRTHIAAPLIIFYGLAVGILFYVIYWGIMSASASIMAFVIGFFSFTLLEYVAHRFAYHMEETTPFRKRMVYIMHGVHHDHPKDKSRLAMPPFLSVILAAGFFFLYKLTMGDFGMPFTAGFIAGYATYLCVHYSVHAFRPPNNFLKTLWIHHAIHHYQNPEVAFGVSSPLWDVVFGTMPAKKSTAQEKKHAGFIDDDRKVRL